MHWVWGIESDVRGGMWKMNPSDRKITLTKLLIKHAKLTSKEIEIGA